MGALISQAFLSPPWHGQDVPGDYYALPSHCWCWLSQFIDVKDLGALLQCSASLLANTDVPTLWQYHALRSGLVRPVAYTNLDWLYPFTNGMLFDQCFDWRQFLQINHETWHLPSVWIRICDVDLRMPLPPVWSRNPTQDLLHQLYPLLVHLDSSLAKKRPIVPGTFLRLRSLQFAGRPGPLMGDNVVPCDHLLLEWALPEDLRWPLPPHDLPSQNQLHGTRPFASDGVTLFDAWKQGYESRGQQSKPWPPEISGDNEREVLARIRFLPIGNGNGNDTAWILGDFWVAIDLSSATVGSLFSKIGTCIKEETPYSKYLGDNTKFKMVNLNHAQDQCSMPHDVLLRDCCWAHSETLTIQIACDPKKILEEGTEVLVCREPEVAQETKAAQALGHQQAYPGVANPQVSTSEKSSEKDSYSDAKSLDSERTAHSRSSADALVLEAGIDGALARLMPHVRPQLLANTKQTRQFEFHPCLPQVILIGDRQGGVNIVQTDDDEVSSRLVIDSSPVLAMSWMHHHPHSAVCGTAELGSITFLRYDSEAASQDMPLHPVHKATNFPALCSLSVNSTDDFLVATGLAHDLALYDIQTGQVLHRGNSIHQNSINVSRFSYNSPHILATASFDQTCKVWDIRQRLASDKPIKTLHTGGPNVMCAFSSDDRSLLCSGIDTHIMQYELPSFAVTHKSLPLRPDLHQNRYRRSMYFASGSHFVTSATRESHIRVLKSSGTNLGVVDFRGVLQELHAPEHTSPLTITERHRPLRRFLQRSRAHEEPSRVLRDSSLLVRGDVRLPIYDQDEYVLSLRTHPTVENCVGVLVSAHGDNAHSCLSILHVQQDS